MICPHRHDCDAMRATMREQRKVLLRVLAVLNDTRCPDEAGNSYALREELRRQLDKINEFTPEPEEVTR